ncbi:MAG: alpha/beta hydrolase [Candidatus Levybacteria bacterium]|nr:alpha/beta hydrolase [Candidatus Levybacteria bacterium]
MINYVLLIGWATAPSYYKKLIDYAPENCRLFIPSYETIFKKGKIEEFEASFLEYLNINQLLKINLIGYSLGGLLSIGFANKYPEKVEKLYLIDSAGIYGNKNVVRQLLNVLGEVRNKDITIRVIKSLPRILGRLSMNVKLGIYANKSDLENEAKAIKVPTTIFWGEKDLVTPLWQGGKLHILIPKSKLIVLKGESHNWIINKPELFWDSI